MIPPSPQLLTETNEQTKSPLCFKKLRMTAFMTSQREKKKKQQHLLYSHIIEYFRTEGGKKKKL